MLFPTKVVFALALSAIGLASPLKRDTPAEAVLTTIDALSKDVAAYKHKIDAFPSSSSNKAQLNALKDITTAGSQIVADLSSKGLWNALNTDFQFTNEELVAVTNALKSKVEANFKSAGNAFQKLQPAVKALGCYDLLNSVYADLTTLTDHWYNAMNYIAFYRIKLDNDYGKHPINTVYGNINEVLGNTLGAYQVGAYPGTGDEPTDNCKS